MVGMAVAKHFIDILKSRVVWLTHRVELRKQVAEHFKNYNFNSSNYRIMSPIQMRNAQTNVARRRDLRKFKSGLLIVDESHHSAAKTWDEAIKMWSGPVLGMTATPWRMSLKEGFARYDNLICGPTLLELVHGRHLSPIEYFGTTYSSIEGRGTDINGDYNQSQTQKHYGEKLRSITQSIIQEALRRANGRRIIVFAMTRKHAYMTRDLVRKEGATAEALESRVKKQDRTEIVHRFREGRTQTLVNVDIVTEGFDCPDAYMCVMLRSTRSRALYMQMIGRVTRISSTDDHCVILDGAGNYKTFARENGHEVPYSADGEWSLTPRQKEGVGGESPVKICGACGEICHAAVRKCKACGYDFGLTCTTCGTWRTRKEYIVGSTECKACGDQREAELERIKIQQETRVQSDSAVDTLQHYTLARSGKSYWRRTDNKTFIIGPMQKSRGRQKYYCMIYDDAISKTKPSMQKWNLGSYAEAHSYTEDTRSKHTGPNLLRWFVG